MRIATLRRHRSAAPSPGLVGVVRLDRRTTSLTSRLRPGEIALIDHVDLDRAAAEALVRAGVAAVVNAAPSISGRYPNLGPEVLVAAGVPVLDRVGPDAFSALRDGQRVRLQDDALYDEHDAVIARGHLLDRESVMALMTQARAGVSVQLEAFASNAMEYLRRDQDLLLDGVVVPRIRTRFAGRHAVVVVRGFHYREDLASLRPYLREWRPVLIGVDGGAEVLRAAGYRPDLIVGELDSVSDATLRCGAEVVVHASPDRRPPSLQRVQDLGITPVVFPMAGTGEDIALLLADDQGAELIVAVGAHATLLEFLDKGSSGMASTFLTRLRVGGKLVGAEAVSRMYRSRVRAPALLALAGAAALVIAIALAATPGGPVLRHLLGIRWDTLLHRLHGVF